MSALHVAVLNTFKSQGWVYQEVAGREVVESGFDAFHGRVLAHVQSFAEANFVTVVANASVVVPANCRTRVAELLMRANKDLLLGAFEMEWDTGQVMFRQGNVFSQQHYDQSLMAGLIHNAVGEMDRLTPFLGEVCRTRMEMLPLLDLPALLKREDLLPPAPEG
ncbi:MAG: YbjN domain-containing protein [Verrucomicrobia bacterium]|nr:YbjN domain-containing protein [Verrucomicrobiota bacterium]